MAEIEPIPLVGVIVTDAAGGLVWLLHRKDHMQWQLPGGRVEEQDDFLPEIAAVRHAKEELGLELHTDYLRRLGSTAFLQWGKWYSSVWYRADTIHDWPRNADPDHYDDLQPHNLLKRSKIRAPKYSPNVVRFADALNEIEFNP